MTQTGGISRDEMVYEEAVEQITDELIKTIGTVQPDEKNNILTDPGLSDEEKTRTLAEMNEFQNIFREKIRSQKENFISELRDFCATFAPVTSEEKANFIVKHIQNYALSILGEEIDNNRKKSDLTQT